MKCYYYSYLPVLTIHQLDRGMGWVIRSYFSCLVRALMTSLLCVLCNYFKWHQTAQKMYKSRHKPGFYRKISTPVTKHLTFQKLQISSQQHFLSSFYPFSQCVLSDFGLYHKKWKCLFYYYSCSSVCILTRHSGFSVGFFSVLLLKYDGALKECEYYSSRKNVL